MQERHMATSILVKLHLWQLIAHKPDVPVAPNKFPLLHLRQRLTGTPVRVLQTDLWASLSHHQRDFPARLRPIPESVHDNPTHQPLSRAVWLSGWHDAAHGHPTQPHQRFHVCQAIAAVADQIAAQILQGGVYGLVEHAQA